MKVYRCTKCDQRGGYLVFRSIKKNNLKYPYVGHYDSTRNSKRKWCSLNKKQLNQIEFVEDWYDKHLKLIEKIQVEYKELGEGNPTLDKHILKAAEMLEKNGFLTYRIEDRVCYDVNHIVISEKEVQNILEESGFSINIKRMYHK